GRVQKEAAESPDVAQVDIGASHDCDALAGTVNKVIETEKVINDGKIPRRERMTAIRQVEIRLYYRCLLCVHGMGVEIMQRYDASHPGSKRARNGRLGDVGLMHFAVDREFMDLCLECLFNARNIAAEIEPVSSFGDFVDGKTLALEPAGDGVQLLIVDAKAFAKLFRRQPF